MWTSVSFATLSDLTMFLNARRLSPESFHVVVARGDDGVQLFHLLYQREAAGEGEVGLAVQEAELLPVVEGAAAEDAAAAVEAAEEILHGDEDEGD